MNYFIDPSFDLDEIFENVFIGTFQSAMNIDLLKTLKISRVLTLGKPLKTNFESEGIANLHVRVYDEETENIVIHIPKCCEFIQQSLDANQKVLVHCAKGVSR